MKTMIMMVIGSLAFVAGFFSVSFLTSHPLQMSLNLFISCLAIFLVVGLLVDRTRGKQMLAGFLLVLVFTAAGYMIRTTQVLAQEDSRTVPDLTRKVGDPGDGHTAVIYFTHGEPETYNPIGWLNQFREFDKQGIAFVPLPFRPFFIYQLREAYLKVGSSHHRSMHIQMLKQLEQAYQAAGDNETRFYLSFLDDEPRPDAAVIQALNEGASFIIVAEVFVSISNHTAEGEELIKEVHAEKLGVPVEFTGPLWDSALLQRSFLEKANAVIGNTSKKDVGVILVGHGQPDEWDVEFPTETEHELAFRRQIFELFAANGYNPENLGLAWMSFKEPKPAVRVEELLAKNVKKILYFSAAISADSIHSQYDIPELVNEANVPETVPVINLGAWNDHPLVIAAIKERIDDQVQMATRP
jgi:protoheme ferro-lyase